MVGVYKWPDFCVFCLYQPLSAHEPWLHHIQSLLSVHEELSIPWSYQKNVNCMFLKFYQGIVGLSCCISSRCISKWVSCRYICISTLFRFFSHIGHLENWVEFPVLYSRSLLFCCKPGLETCGTWFPDQGLNPYSLPRKDLVLTTGPSKKSPLGPY